MEPYKLLEQRFAKEIGTKFAVSCNTGTAGLHLALAALGVGEGDEVIVPSFTMAACGFAVAYCHAKPVFVDCGIDLNIDVDLITRAITPRTKVIMAVDIYGRPCNIGRILTIARKHRLRVVADCSEAFGATVAGKRVGNYGDIAVFSLYKNKIVAAQEGGICLTNNADLALRMNHLKNMAFGEKHDYTHDVVGFNYRMSDAQARIALGSLEKAPKNIAKRLKLVEWYDELLGAHYGRPVPREKNHAQWVYDILLDSPRQVDAAIKAIPGARYFFRPLDTMPMWRGDTVSPVAAAASSAGLLLPLSPSLTKSDVTTICKKLLRL